ncbi:hypothetical protein BC829DRAFT_400539 [Chytridium lagenaria]|nr:hypothetical protein BC829DRAFT_400539 [Chytridium lagenaria]
MCRVSWFIFLFVFSRSFFFAMGEESFPSLYALLIFGLLFCVSISWDHINEIYE